MRPDRQVFEAGGRGTQLPVVDARAVVKSYGAGRAARRVLDGIDLEIAPGELVAVVGRSAPASRRSCTCSAVSIVPTKERSPLRGSSSSGSRKRG